MRKILPYLLLFFFVFNTVASVWMDADNEYHAGGWTFRFQSDQTLEYFEIGENYTNLTWGTDFKNITYAFDETTTQPILEQHSSVGVGHTTTLGFDLYAPSDWTVDKVYLRLDTNDSVQLENISKGLLTESTVNTTHMRYSYSYDPDTGDDVDWEDMQMDVWAYCYNDTLRYSGYREFDSVFELYELDPPYSPTSDLWFDSTMNLTWTSGNHSNQDVVVAKAASYPSSVSDGTVIHNQTSNTGKGNKYNGTQTNTTRYYRAWSYNSTTNSFSSTGLDLPWGILNITVHNESSPWLSVGKFGVEISNEAGTDTYSNVWTNGLWIDFNDIPYGDNTIIKINSTNYRDRTYYYDLTQNRNWTLTLYLPPINVTVDPGTGDDGGDTTATKLYFVQVIDQANNPIEGADINVSRYMNNTDSYDQIGSLITDGYGYASINLIPNALYKVTVSKDDYDTEISDWIPDPTYYGTAYPKIVQLAYTETDPAEPDIEPEEITFNGWRHEGLLYVNYTDTMEQTINTSIRVYETNINTTTTITFGWDNKTSNNDFQVIFEDANSSRTYTVVLHYNHTTFGYIKKSFIINAELDTFTTQTRSDSLFDAVFGHNPFGWTNTFFWVFLVGCFFAFGQRGAGLGMVFTGGLMLFVNYVVGFNTTLALAAGGVIPILVIIVGVMMVIRNKQRREVTA